MSDFNPSSTKTEESATYSRSKDGSHVFKGSENAVLVIMDRLDLQLDTEPKRHLVTGAIISSSFCSVLSSDGIQVAFFLTPTSDSPNHSLVINKDFKHDALEQEMVQS